MQSLANQFASDAVVIHGPQGCGKTRNAAALAHAFGKVFVLEHDSVIPTDKYPADALVFTSEALPGAMPFEKAMQLAGLTQAGAA